MSLQVSSVAFFEHHTTEWGRGGGGVNGTPQGFKRLCVMETEVTNRTEGPLQVGLASLSNCVWVSYM